jgi:hypothetical protein
MASRKPLVIVAGLLQQLSGLPGPSDSLSINPGVATNDAPTLQQIGDVIMTSGDPNDPELMFDANGSIMLHLRSV